MQFAYIDDSRKAEWEELVSQNSASGFMQSFFWADFKRQIGWETFKIAILEKDKIIGGAIIGKFQFSKDKNFLYIPEGPIIPQKNQQKYFDLLMTEIDKIADLKGPQRTTHIRIEPRLLSVPNYYSMFKKAPYNMQPKNTLILDLTQSEDAILSNMKSDARYCMRLAKKNNLSVKSGINDKLLEKFLEVYRQTIARNNFEGKDPEYFKQLRNVLNENNGSIFTVQKDRLILAAALVIFFGNRATYFFAGSSNEGGKMMAPYLLQWGIILNSRFRGLQFYDFWGVSPDKNNHNHPWQGFSLFKRKFGGRQVDFIGAYDFVYNQSLYRKFLEENREI